MAKRPGFESFLGKLGDESLPNVRGTNETPGMRLTSQDVVVSGPRSKEPNHLQAFSSVNASNPSGAEGKKLGPTSFPYRALDVEDSPIQSQPMDTDDWLKKAQDAFAISDSYFQSDIKPKLEDNIRAFNSQHKANSIYVKAPQGWTSKLYIPKTRSILNKYQAACCVALFSNQDIISIEAENAFDIGETVAVAVHKALLQYRLKKTLHWFHVALGAFQDAMVQGVVIGHVCWDVKVDKPEVKIFPLDNVRFDPDADWIDPVNSSPYWITLRDMTINEYREYTKSKPDGSPGLFYDLSDAELSQAIGATDNSIQKTREQSQSGQSYSQINGYNRITIQEHIHRDGDHDVIFYTLGTSCRVSDVMPIEEMYFHGKRPYVLGVAEIESHRIFNQGFPDMMTGLQEEINEVTNQRLNNVKLALNRKFAIKTDSQVDLDALLRNQPGSAVFVDDPDHDIRPLDTPDVSQSSFMEIDKLNQYTDDLTGNFNPPAGFVNKVGDAGRAMQMLNSNVNVLLEYRLRVFCETFITPMLCLLDKTEAHYETDPKILEIIARQVGIIRTPKPEQQVQGQANGLGVPPQPVSNPMPQMVKFDDNHLKYMRELLQKDLSINTNVGMNATDPMFKLQKLIAGVGALRQWNPGMQLDREEISKEVMALCGYMDGMRFINQTVDPKDLLIRQLQMAIKQQQAKESQRQQGQKDVAIIKEHGANLRKAADIEQQTAELKSDNAQFVLDHGLDRSKHALEVVQSQQEANTTTSES